MYFVILFFTLSPLLFVHRYRMSFSYRLCERAVLAFLLFTFQFSLSLLLQMTKPPTERSSQMCLLPQPGQSDGMPQVNLPLPDSGSCGKEMDLADEISFVNNDVFFSRLVFFFFWSLCFSLCLFCPCISGSGYFEHLNRILEYKIN